MKIWLKLSISSIATYYDIPLPFNLKDTYANYNAP